jgi:hypothetical protein
MEIKSKWGEKITMAILLVMHDCYDGAGDIRNYEWEQGDDGGVKAFLISIIRKELKKAYLAGYAHGAQAAVVAANSHGAELVYAEGDNRIGAERSFLKWEKEQ